MLRTCKEIYHDSSAILVCENKFAINISADAARLCLELSRISALRSQNFTQNCPSVLLPLSRLRKVRIVINLKSKSDYSSTYIILHEACPWLRKVQQLSLILDIQFHPGMERYFCVLEPLLSLRKVHEVNFQHKNDSYDTRSVAKHNIIFSESGWRHEPTTQPSIPGGIPPEYASYLRQVITGSSHFITDYQVRQLYRGLIKYIKFSQVPQQYKLFLIRLGTHSFLLCHKGSFESCIHRQMLSRSW